MFSQALTLRLEGLSYSEIGRKLGVSRQRAQQILMPPPPIYNLIRKRAGDRCERCGVFVTSGHVHHRNWQDGNHNNPDELEYLCPSCHMKSHPGIGGRRKRKQLGTCMKCSRTLGKSKRYCDYHLQKKAAGLRRRNARFRERGLCAKCGANRDDPAFIGCSKCRQRTREAVQKDRIEFREWKEMKKHAANTHPSVDTATVQSDNG